MAIQGKDSHGGEGCYAAVLCGDGGEPRSVVEHSRAVAHSTRRGALDPYPVQRRHTLLRPALAGENCARCQLACYWAGSAVCGAFLAASRRTGTAEVIVSIVGNLGATR